MPLTAPLRLTHLRVALVIEALGRTGGVDDRGIHHRALLQRQRARMQGRSSCREDRRFIGQHGGIGKRANWRHVTRTQAISACTKLALTPRMPFDGDGKAAGISDESLEVKAAASRVCRHVSGTGTVCTGRCGAVAARQ